MSGRFYAEEDFKDFEVAAEELLRNVVASHGYFDCILISELRYIHGESLVQVLDCQEDRSIEQAVLVHVMVREHFHLVFGVKLIGTTAHCPSIVHQELVQVVDCFYAQHSQNRPIILIFGENGISGNALSPFVFLDRLDLILIRREIVEGPHLTSVDSHIPVLELLSVDCILFVSLEVDPVFDLEELTRLLGVFGIVFALLPKPIKWLIEFWEWNPLVGGCFLFRDRFFLILVPIQWSSFNFIPIMRNTFKDVLLGLGIGWLGVDLVEWREV